MAYFVSARLRTVSPTQPAWREFRPGAVWILGQPRVGCGMLLRGPGSPVVHTTRIERLTDGAAQGDLYVQTSNSLYRLQRA